MSAVWRELLRSTALALAGLAVLLLAGQVGQLREVLLAAGGLERTPWARALGLGGLVLAEALLPLGALLGAGLAYGRLRAEGFLLARAALAGGPVGGLAPAALLGLALGGAAAVIAREPAPRAVAALRDVALAVAAGAFEAGERAVALPGGGVLAGRPAWAALPAGAGRVMLLRAEGVRARIEGGSLHVELQDVRLWGPDLRVQVGVATVRLADGGLGRRLGMLGPPNATPSAALGDGPHHRFVWHRRWAMPALAPLWAILGALLGGALGGAWATLAAAATVGGAYWVLRVGELAARAGDLPPALAAWAPVAITALALALLAPRLARRLEA